MMNIKALKEYNESRHKYHKLLSEELGKKYVRHILYKTKRIQDIYRLEANAAEEVEQELSIAAFKARENWTDEMNIKKSTFTFSAINKHAAYLARTLSGLPIMENYEAGVDMQEVGILHKTTQEKAQRIYDKNIEMYPDSTFTTPEGHIRKKWIQKKERPKVKPSVISCGSELAGLLDAKPVCDNPLKMDIEEFYMTLGFRQQILVLLLEDNFSQVEIAAMFGITQPSLNEQIDNLRTIFMNFQNL